MRCEVAKNAAGTRPGDTNIQAGKALERRSCLVSHLLDNLVFGDNRQRRVLLRAELPGQQVERLVIRGIGSPGERFLYPRTTWKGGLISAAVAQFFIEEKINKRRPCCHVPCDTSIRSGYIKPAGRVSLLSPGSNSLLR